MAPLRPEFPALMNRLAGSIPREILEDIHRCSLKRRTGISLSQMMSFRPQEWLQQRIQRRGAGGNGGAPANGIAHAAAGHPSSTSVSTYSNASNGSSSSSSNNSDGAGGLVNPLITSARFLQDELPIRFAHRIAELDHLPQGLSDMPHVLKVRNWYVRSFVDLRRMGEVQSEGDEEEFTRVISRIKTRHNRTLEYMAMGLAELKQELQVTQPGLPMEEFPEVHHFLDRFFLSRIGIRMLIGQHIAVHRQMEAARAGRLPEDSTMIGLIDTQCNPVLVAERAVADAKALCLRAFGSAPDVQVIGDPALTFPYVPRHLHQMLLELVANSLRAVHERFTQDAAALQQGESPHSFAITTSASAAPTLSSHAPGHGASRRPPLIRIVVADGVEDVTIKVSDEGGGIKRSGLPRIWSYLYSTASVRPLEPTRRKEVKHKRHQQQAAAALTSSTEPIESPHLEGTGEAQPMKPPVFGDLLGMRWKGTPSENIWSVHSRPQNILEEEEEDEEEAEEAEFSAALGSALLHGQQLSDDEMLQKGEEGGLRARARGIMAGHGNGLPIARLYARYFGGDLQIFSMDGYGTDAYLHLNRLRNVQEPLP